MGVEQNNWVQPRGPGISNTEKSESKGGLVVDMGGGQQGPGQNRGWGNLDISLVPNSSREKVRGNRKFRLLNTDHLSSLVTVANVPLYTEEVYVNKRN